MLQSPLYEQPVMNFIDNQCLIFDLEEENKLEYTKVGPQADAWMTTCYLACQERLNDSDSDSYNAADASEV